MDLTKSPQQGVMYAAYPDKVIFETYSMESLRSSLCEKRLLELHLFNENIEYRLIRTRKGMIEVVVSDENTEYDDVFVEKVLTNNIMRKSEKQKIPEYVEVVNYLSYNPDNQLVINNYRLKEVIQ